MTLLVQHQLILAKIETAYNTDADPAPATNSILVQDLSWTQHGLRMEKRPALRVDSISPLQPVYGGELCQIEFTCEVKGSGTAGTAPEIDPLLQACGMAATIAASISVTYAPISTNSGIKSCTIYHEYDGNVQKLTGCMGTVNFTIKSGMIVTAKFTFTGHVESRVAGALGTPTFNATVPVAAINMSGLLIGAYAPVAQSFALDVGTKVETPANLGAADGYGPIMISERDSKGTIEVEADLLGNVDFFTDISDGTAINFTTGAIGSAAGNKVTFNVPQLVVTGIKPGNSNGIITATVDYQAVESSTPDTNFSIEFT
ncbi:MAG: hypothetical protein KGL39_34770 [Patescibacteria group bacterium]|nr:hypothetical protein [Patescibacteria group bacterium]